MRHFLIFGLFLILGFIGFMTFHLGAFKPVEIFKEPRGPYYVIAKKHMGAYHTTVKSIEEVEQFLAEKKISCPLSFGEYMDDPAKVETERLRSRGGCLYLEPLTLTEPLPSGFEMYQVEVKDYVVALFDGAPSIGPVKVYPKVHEYMDKEKLKSDGSVFEVYEILDKDKPNAMKTTYMFPVKSESSVF